MATLTKGKTFTNGETVTPQKLHELIDLGTVTGIVNADISATAAIADIKLAQITTANKVAQSAVTNLTTDLAGKAPATGIAPSAIAGTAVVTTDSRLSDARTPTSHTHGNLTNAGAIGSTSGAPIITGASGVLQAGSFGTTAGTFCQGNDSRLSDARTPTSHTHGNLTNAGAIGSTANLPVVTTTSGVLTTIPAGSAGQVLTSNGGTSAPSFQTLAATSTNANNLTGGSAGTVPYQSAAGTTAMLAAGTSGQVLRSNGAAAPSWLTLSASATTDTTNAANITTGTLPLARIPTGTTNSTVCIGNDSRLSDARTPVDASVTTAKLDNSTKQMLVPAGAVMPFAMNSAPTGWLAADGTEYSKTGIYSALFAAIGTVHGETNGSGGSGTSHFRVPDLRGIFIRGASSQTISGITYSGTFGTKQGDAMQGHVHLAPTRAVAQNNGNNYTGIPLGNADTSNGANTGSPISDGTNGTPRTASETRPANIALLYCIKF